MFDNIGYLLAGLCAAVGFFLEMQGNIDPNTSSKKRRLVRWGFVVALASLLFAGGQKSIDDSNHKTEIDAQADTISLLRKEVSLSKDTLLYSYKKLLDTAIAGLDSSRRIIEMQNRQIELIISMNNSQKRIETKSDTAVALGIRTFHRIDTASFTNGSKRPVIITRLNTPNPMFRQNTYDSTTYNIEFQVGNSTDAVAESLSFTAGVIFFKGDSSILLHKDRLYREMPLAPNSYRTFEIPVSYHHCKSLLDKGWRGVYFAHITYTDMFKIGKYKYCYLISFDEIKLNTSLNKELTLRNTVFIQSMLNELLFNGQFVIAK